LPRHKALGYLKVRNANPVFQGIKENLMKKRPKQLIVIGLLILLWASAIDTVHGADFQPLVGRWQRTDGGYVIEIGRIDADGKIAAGYFNPRPINVSRAQASMQRDYIKVEVELRDTGYPGSRYTLIYDQPKDRLIGFYYHAVSGQNFDVVFVRQK
jgi:hypothetical protein